VLEVVRVGRSHFVYYMRCEKGGSVRSLL
jgi:hypothetical protein